MTPPVSNAALDVVKAQALRDAADKIASRAPDPSCCGVCRGRVEAVGYLRARADQYDAKGGA